MSRTFHAHANIEYLIGDVRDLSAVKTACSKADYVFHLAALKHVPIGEAQPLKVLNTNVYGTENIIQASMEQEVQKVIYVSTDKAAAPVNLYGFVCIRAGNDEFFPYACRSDRFAFEGGAYSSGRRNIRVKNERLPDL